MLGVREDGSSYSRSRSQEPQSSTIGSTPLTRRSISFDAPSATTTVASAATLRNSQNLAPSAYHSATPGAVSNPLQLPPPLLSESLPDAAQLVRDFLHSTIPSIADFDLSAADGTTDPSPNGFDMNLSSASLSVDLSELEPMEQRGKTARRSMAEMLLGRPVDANISFGLSDIFSLAGDLSPSASLPGSITDKGPNSEHRYGNNPIDENSDSLSLSLPESFDAPVFHHNTMRGGPTPLCRRCHEIVTHASQESKSADKRIMEMSETIAGLQRQQRDLEAELALVRRLGTLSEESKTVEVKALEDRCRHLQELLESELEGKTVREARLRELERASEENHSLRERLREADNIIADQRATISACVGSGGTGMTVLTMNEHQRQLDLSRQDVAHLTKELQYTEQRLEDSHRATEAERSKAASLELRVSSLTEQLLAVQLSMRSDAEARLERELSRVTAESTRQIELARESALASGEREVRIIRDAKAIADAEVSNWRRQAETYSAQLVDAQAALASAERERLTETSELRSELRVKTYELTTLGVSFEERNARLRTAELSLERTEAELRAHQSALLRAEAESTATITRLNSELSSAQQRLAAYEALEVEIDQAVMSAAEKTLASGTTGDIIPGEVFSGGSMVPMLTTGECGTTVDVEISGQAVPLVMSRGVIRGIPASPERRVRQAVYLAQRLLETERARDAALADLEKLREDLTESNRVAEEAKVALSRAAQPTTYLVNKLREAEVSLATSQRQGDRLREEIESLRSSGDVQATEIKQLRERLAALLQQRGELHTVKQILRHLQQQQEEGSETESEEEDSVVAESVESSLGFSDFRRRMAAHMDNSETSSMSPHRTLPPALTQARSLGLSPAILARMTTPPSTAKRVGIASTGIASPSLDRHVSSPMPSERGEHSSLQSPF